MDNAQLMFESYNHAVEAVYERLFADSRGDEILKLEEEKVSGLLDAELKLWESTPVAELGNMMPREFFEGIDSLENAIKIFVIGAKVCDRGIPDMLVDKLETFGGAAVDELMKLAEEDEFMNSEEDSYIPIIAIRTLGKLRSEKAIEPLLNLVYSLNEGKENIVEEVNDALVDIGKPIIEPVVNIINNAGTIGYIDEYVINALVRVGKDNQSDSVFRCLKSAFGRMEDKLLGALCLGDYGDGRAIPALRGYIEKNRGNVNKATFLEIVAAIKRLGGNVDDLI